MSRLPDLRDFGLRFPDRMNLQELRWWRNHWKTHADLLAPKIRKQAMKQVHEIDKAIDRKTKPQKSHGS